MGTIVDPSATIDESLYSRQIYVLGENAMRRLSHSDVLISGMSGLGVEIAKNLILAGISNIVIHDETLTTWEDLSSQFYLSEKSIGKNRAAESLDKLKRLNPTVSLSVKTDKITKEELKQFQIICSDDEEFSEFCHANGILFILAESRGPFCRVFCDFGDEFVVSDPDELDPVKIPVTLITNEEAGLVQCLVDKSHGFQVGDIVEFNAVKGMEEINDQISGYVITEVLSAECFRIGNTKEFGHYSGGGTVEKRKLPITLHFGNLESSKKCPKFITSDMQTNPLKVHLGFNTLNMFRTLHDRLPRLWNEEDANEFVGLAYTINCANENTPSHLKNVDPTFFSTFSKTCGGVLGPAAAFLGGFVAQEIIKGCTRKFTPLQQWFFCDFASCLPQGHLLETRDYLNKDRYSGTRDLIGDNLQNTLTNSKIFVVGAGAIGCEILKNLALMGVGSGERGEIIVTDMDFIEKSNLSRQFLFHSTDIGKSKSKTAAAAILKMNPRIKIKALELEVGGVDETAEEEGEFNHSFYESLDCVVNALDNVTARLYVDEKCVDHSKPLLESGTQGAKGSTQVILPGLTKSYSDTTDPPPTTIPWCTLKVFPYRIDHTIEWARELFEDNFKLGPSTASKYLTDGRFKIPTGDETEVEPHTLSQLIHFFSGVQPKNFSDCMKWAILHYNRLFVWDIEDLTSHYPLNCVNTKGQPFWSGTKKFPTPIPFNWNDKLCQQFVTSGANVRASVFEIPTIKELSELEPIYANMAMAPEAEIRPPVVKFPQNFDEDTTEAPPPVLDNIDELMAQISQLSQNLTNLKINPQIFEKDDDQNFHIDFISSSANLRALNYSIETTDRSNVKRIAGKIIPAISTSTSCVAGLVCLEIYKLLDKYEESRDITRFRDYYISLAIPLVMGFNPKKVNCTTDVNGFKWSKWNRPVIQGDISCRSFLEQMYKKYKIEVSAVSYGVYLIYYDWMDQDEKNICLDQKITTIIAEVTEKELHPGVKELKLVITSSHEDHKDMELPSVRYILH